MGSIFNNLYEDIKNEFEMRKPTGVRSAGIYGSFSRGEAKENWSDMDVMIFTDEDKINPELFRILESMNKSLSKKYPSIPITFRIHSFDEFPRYRQHEGSICPYSLFSYYKDMIFFYGKDLREEMKIILKSSSIKESIADLRSKLLSSRHESRSLITSSNEFQPFIQSFHVNIHTEDILKYKISKFADMVLECALCCNVLKGYFVRKKAEIAENFKALFPNFKYSNLPLECNTIRENWSNKNIALSNDFFQNCANFFEEIIDLFDQNIDYNQINNAFEGFLINDSKLKYRKNVCAIAIDEDNRILIVKKEEDNSWQFIQGGVNENESLLDALKREIKEEIGLNPEQLKTIAAASHLNIYDWPTELQTKKGFRGQEQSFFVVGISDKNRFKLNEEELMDYKWVDINEIHFFITRSDLIESLNAIKKQFPEMLK
ncbi:NUDIX domain-containing protein [Candidatus Pacearchaeota archaeon]|nr:NUDIX domain-containing protein [Candidatus Pacearchaeota archaeon]